MKKILLTLLKLSISVGIIAYLVWKATRTRGPGNVDVFTNLVDEPKDWWMLFWAWAFSAAAVVLTFIRWWYLVRALDIPCRFRDAIRISFWGFLFNLAPLGIVGGDLVKAVMLAHEHRQYRAKAVASVLFDRVIGLIHIIYCGIRGHFAYRILADRGAQNPHDLHRHIHYHHRRGGWNRLDVRARRIRRPP